MSTLLNKIGEVKFVEVLKKLAENRRNSMVKDPIRRLRER
jgi:hypothetical protein